MNPKSGMSAIKESLVDSRMRTLFVWDKPLVLSATVERGVPMSRAGSKEILLVELWITWRLPYEPLV
jgi:hypothetical protein